MTHDGEPTPAAPVDGRPPTVVEAEQPLSRSLVWALQRRYFERAGISAWSNAAIPHYVTSNPALATGSSSEVVPEARR